MDVKKKKEIKRLIEAGERVGKRFDTFIRWLNKEGK
jgi:hypothetical protein